MVKVPVYQAAPPLSPVSDNSDNTANPHLPSNYPPDNSLITNVFAETRLFEHTSLVLHIIHINHFVWHETAFGATQG